MKITVLWQCADLLGRTTYTPDGTVMYKCVDGQRREKVTSQDISIESEVINMIIVRIIKQH